MPRGDRKNWGGARPGPHPGRPATKATIKEGTALMLSQVYPDGTADLGRGTAVIESIGRSRLIKIPQTDGSEIRILVLA